MPMFRSAYGATYTSPACRWSSTTWPADHRLDRRPADRRAAGDGGDAADRVPQPPPAAAAGDRAGRHRHHLRAAGGPGRDADDGLDRGAADPDRARRRLRDPVPGARAGGARAGRARGRRRRSQRPRGRARRPAGPAPTIATAALATATGFLVLLLSPVPMVQGFGLLLVVGIAVALVCALTAGSAALVLGERDGGCAGRVAARRRRDPGLGRRAVRAESRVRRARSPACGAARPPAPWAWSPSTGRAGPARARGGARRAAAGSSPR